MTWMKLLQSWRENDNATTSVKHMQIATVHYSSEFQPLLKNTISLSSFVSFEYYYYHSYNNNNNYFYHVACLHIHIMSLPDLN